MSAKRNWVVRESDDFSLEDVLNRLCDEGYRVTHIFQGGEGSMYAFKILGHLE